MTALTEAGKSADVLISSHDNEMHYHRICEVGGFTLFKITPVRSSNKENRSKAKPLPPPAPRKIETKPKSASVDRLSALESAYTDASKDQ